MEWLASGNQPSSFCFEGKTSGVFHYVKVDLCWIHLSDMLAFSGVDVWIENVQGQCLRIRERRRVKVGHIAIGISDQV